MTLGHGVAVAAAAVHFAEGVDSEPSDRERSTAVVLEDLVCCAECAATGDGRRVARILLLDRKGVLTNSRPSHILEIAGTKAVDTFDLVRADDAV